MAEDSHEQNGQYQIDEEQSEQRQSDHGVVKDREVRIRLDLRERVQE